MAWTPFRLRRYFGDRAFYREVATISLPIIFQQLIATAMGFIDSVMIGQIDAQAMAGIMVANRFFLILMTAMLGISGGVCIFISQYFGADDHDKGQGLLALNMMCCFSVALVFLAAASIFPQEILRLFVSDPLTISYGVAFLGYIRFSYLPFAINMAVMSSLRAIGQTRTPFVVGSIGIVLGTALNYNFIFGALGQPAMGVAGAGLGTMIARTVEMLIYLGILASNRKYFNLKLTLIRRLSREILARIARKAIPLTGNELIWSFGTIMIFKAYTQVDEPNIASLTILEAVSNAAFVILHGFSASVAILVGARLGANRFEEARQNASRLIAMGFAFGLFIAIIAALLGRHIVTIYNVSDQIRQMAAFMIYVQTAILPLIAMNFIIFVTFRTGGDVKSTLTMDSLFVWILIIPLAFALSFWTKISMPLFFAAIQSTEILKFLLALHLFRRNRWIRNLT